MTIIDLLIIVGLVSLGAVILAGLSYYEEPKPKQQNPIADIRRIKRETLLEINEICDSALDEFFEGLCELSDDRFT